MHIVRASVIRGLHQQSRGAVDVLLCRGGVVDSWVSGALNERRALPFRERDVSQGRLLIVNCPAARRGGSEHVKVAVFPVDHHYGSRMVVSYSAEDVVCP